MANSRKYNALISRIHFLENTILPNVRISGNYTKKESDLIRSYVLLVHAEIEYYFENVAKDKAVKSLRKWMNNRKKNNCLLAIMAFCSAEINWDKKSKINKTKLDYRINETVNHYIGRLNNNNGVKAKNIRDILLPIGIEEHELDEAWLSIMDSFGVTRGMIAHNTIGVQRPIDLVIEKNNINQYILREIQRLDELLKLKT